METLEKWEYIRVYANTRVVFELMHATQVHVMWFYWKYQYANYYPIALRRTLGSKPNP